MKKGNTVTWESQSQGIWTRKTGVVISEIPAGESANKHLPSDVKKSHIKFNDVSQRDRVLVAVQDNNGTGVTHYYCPQKNTILHYEINEKKWLEPLLKT